MSGDPGNERPPSLTEVADQFNDAFDVIPIVEGLMAKSRSPRCASDLLDLVSVAFAGRANGPSARGTLLDAGAGTGAWATRIRERFGCFVVAVDLADRPLRVALSDGVPGTVGDLHRLPFRAESLDAIWCRDTLSCVPDPVAVLREFGRVLRPGGGVVLYTAITTPRLEPRERAELFEDLHCPPWWHDGAAPIEEAIRSAGFAVVHRDNFAGEAAEAALRECDRDLIHDLVTFARLIRERDRFHGALGPKWYGRWRAWMSWNLLLLLGKLEARAWVVRKPELAR